jgi:hypothetical protein
VAYIHVTREHSFLEGLEKLGCCCLKASFQNGVDRETLFVYAQHVRIYQLAVGRCPLLQGTTCAARA